MKILMIPADQTRDANPFNQLLNKSLRQLGVTIVSSENRLSALCKVDILHIHWPHNAASAPSLCTSIIRSIRLVAGCLYHKSRGTKIIWTVHDLESLDVVHPKLEHTLMKWFERQVDGLILLTSESRKLLLALRPALEKKPFIIIPHGVYGDTFPNCANQAYARTQLNLPLTGTILGFLGDIKQYKGYDILLEAVIKLGSEAPCILIAGACNDQWYRQTLGALIQKARCAGIYVKHVDSRLSKEELATMIDAVDVVALPYVKSLNSGLALLALERRRRIIASTQPSFMSLRAELGSYWILSSDSTNYDRLLRSLLASTPTQEENANLERFLEIRTWPKLAQLTISFYRKVMS